MVRRLDLLLVLSKLRIGKNKKEQYLEQNKDKQKISSAPILKYQSTFLNGHCKNKLKTAMNENTMNVTADFIITKKGLKGKICNMDLQQAMINNKPSI